MKPRLRREHSILAKRIMWFCRGGGALGIGVTAKEAYDFWRWRIESF